MLAKVSLIDFVRTGSKADALSRPNGTSRITSEQYYCFRKIVSFREGKSLGKRRVIARGAIRSEFGETQKKTARTA